MHYTHYRYGEPPEPCHVSYIGVFAGSRRPQPIFQRRQASLVDDGEDDKAEPKVKLLIAHTIY
jgi:hypothetical protein